MGKGARSFQRHARDAVTSRLRLRGYDYSTPGAYFVTICIEERTCLLGDICDEVMLPSPAGVVVESWWHSIPQRFPDVLLDAFVVMPNHVHGIVILGVNARSTEKEPLPSLSAVIQWFKGVTTNDYMLGVRSEGWPRFPGKLWQKNFYEHIIRSDAALERLRLYIDANPSQWSQDVNNPDRTNG